MLCPPPTNAAPPPAPFLQLIDLHTENPLSASSPPGIFQSVKVIKGFLCALGAQGRARGAARCSVLSPSLLSATAVRSHACEPDQFGKPGGCSDICLLGNSHKSRTCRCRSGFSLGSDGKSCKSECCACAAPGGTQPSFPPSHSAQIPIRCWSCPVVPAEPEHELFLVYGKGRPGIIRGMDMGAKVPDEHMIPIENLMNPRALDFHAETGFIYFADTTSYLIGRQKIDGTERETILKDGVLLRGQMVPRAPQGQHCSSSSRCFLMLLFPVGIHNVEGIAVDWMGNNLYWTDDGPKKTISVARLEKAAQTRKTLIEGKMTHPRAIVVDPLNGWAQGRAWGVLTAVCGVCVGWVWGAYGVCGMGMGCVWAVHGMHLGF